jgi:tetratricopeptide (TPR) repeat protein
MAWLLAGLLVWVIDLACLYGPTFFLARSDCAFLESHFSTMLQAIAAAIWILPGLTLGLAAVATARHPAKKRAAFFLMLMAAGLFALAFTRREAFKDASGFWEDAARRFPERTKPAAKVHHARCIAAYAQEAFGDAHDACRNALAAERNLEEPYVILARLYLGVNELEYAISYLEELHRRFPENVSAWLLLGHIARRRGQTDQAKLLLANARVYLQKHPDPALAAELQTEENALARLPLKK